MTATMSKTILNFPAPVAETGKRVTFRDYRMLKRLIPKVSPN